MADDQIIPGAAGENTETPAGSPPEITTSEPSGDENPQGASPASPEEVAWNNLKGSTQDRIKDILSERDSIRAEKERLEAFVKSQNLSQPTPSSNPSPEVQNAVQKLSEIGLATKEEVTKQVNQSIGNLIYNFELEKLENKYDGGNGLPKFERAEYQDFINRNPKYQAYDPEDVYQKMYEEELLDAKMKSISGAGQSTGTSSLRPTKTTVREEQWTPEWIETRMKQSDGLDWYFKNKEKVNQFLASQTGQ